MGIETNLTGLPRFLSHKNKIIFYHEFETKKNSISKERAKTGSEEFRDYPEFERVRE